MNRTEVIEWCKTCTNGEWPILASDAKREHHAPDGWTWTVNELNRVILAHSTLDPVKKSDVVAPTITHSTIESGHLDPSILSITGTLTTQLHIARERVVRAALVRHFGDEWKSFAQLILDKKLTFDHCAKSIVISDADGPIVEVFEPEFEWRDGTVSVRINYRERVKNDS